MVVTAFHALALALYVLAAGILAASLVEGRRRAPRGVIAACGAALLAHAGGLVAYTLTFDELPLVGLTAALSTLGLVIGAFLFAVEWLREAPPLGLVLAPLIAVLLGVVLALGFAPAREPLAFRGAWFTSHVILAFLGYAGLAVAFAAGLLYLLQFRELTGKHFGRMFRFFPSLDLLDRVGRRALAIGFPALSAALLLGWAWTIRFEQSLAARDTEVIWGVLTWFVFLGALGARRGGAGRNRRGALASVVGFVVVVLAYVVLRLSMAEGRLFL